MYQSAIRPAPFELSTHSLQSQDNTLDWKVSNSIASVQNFSLPLCGRDGLQTPPADGMCAEFSNQYYGSYLKDKNNFSMNNMSSETRMSGCSTCTHPQVGVDLPSLDSNINDQDKRLSFHAAQSLDQQVPKMEQERAMSELQTRRKNVAVDSSQTKMQIPSSICPEGGSLSDFAAQITCLFWFDSMETLNEAIGFVPILSARIIKPETIPSNAFKKWVSNLLSTTLLSENVIILALLFIYRLKKYNPSVKGRSGSEYRLFTVALMLGNKFLDDNTYTNNTWADVSGISVQEIHVMEVEFLSNMRYSLMVSNEQWEEWHRKLGLFKLHCEAAIRASMVPCPPPTMPSPPESTRASPPSNNRYAHLDSTRRQWPIINPLSTTPLLSPSYYTRKRSLETDAGEVPVKKAILPNGRGIKNTPHRLTNVTRNNVSHLPPVSTNQYNGPEVERTFNSDSTNLVLPPLGTLPPMNPRVTPDIFTSNPTNPSTPFWSSQFMFQTPLRKSTSPQNHSSVQEFFSYNSSPVSANPVNLSGHISPSIFLRQRSSPYNPVRHVNTLLYTPPFGSINETSINVQEMRYRTIGRNNENLRTGVVPHWPMNLQSQQ